MSIRHRLPDATPVPADLPSGSAADGAESAQPYAVLAPYYDHLLGHFRGRFEAVRDRVLQELHRQPPGVYADLGCGTGTSCLQMAFRGWQSFGVDKAPGMLAAAREKLTRLQAAPPTILSWLSAADHRRLRRMTAREAQATLRPLAVTFVPGQFTDFRLPLPADFITCLFDSINHLPQTADLRPALAAIQANLAPGGRLLCDFNTPRAIREVWPALKPEVHEDLEQGYYAVVQSGGPYDRTMRQARVRWTWFLRAPEHTSTPANTPAATPAWRRVEETYAEVAWSRAELRAACKAAGLKLRWIKDAGDLHPGFERGWRWFLLAERP